MPVRGGDGTLVWALHSLRDPNPISVSIYTYTGPGVSVFDFGITGAVVEIHVVGAIATGYCDQALMQPA